MVYSFERFGERIGQCNLWKLRLHVRMIGWRLNTVGWFVDFGKKTGAAKRNVGCDGWQEKKRCRCAKKRE